MSTQPETALSPALAEQAPGWLRTMLLIRRFEERAEQLTTRGKIPGGVHPAVGQEATAVGAAAALTTADTVSASHRGHHHALAKGISADGLMAELYGKATGVSGGRGGPCTWPGSMLVLSGRTGSWGRPSASRWVTLSPPITGVKNRGRRLLW